MIPSIAVSIFFVVQIFAFVFVWVVRYHLSSFGMQGDLGSSSIVTVMALGVLVGFFISGYYLLATLNLT